MKASARLTLLLGWEYSLHGSCHKLFSGTVRKGHALSDDFLNCCKIWFRVKYNTAIFAWQPSPQNWEDTTHSNQVTGMHLRIWVWTVRQLFCGFLQDLQVFAIHWSLKCFSFTARHSSTQITYSPKYTPIKGKDFFLISTDDEFMPWNKKYHYQREV